MKWIRAGRGRKDKEEGIERVWGNLEEFRKRGILTGPCSGQGGGREEGGARRER